jgi:ribosome-binding factor A
MAQGRRVERMAALIRREVSELLVNGIKDERVHQGMVSVTHADVAGDLQHCRIFVSVLGSEEDRQLVLDGLKAAAPYVKGELGRRLKMRRTPEVVWNGGPRCWGCSAGSKRTGSSAATCLRARAATLPIQRKPPQTRRAERTTTAP